MDKDIRDGLSAVLRKWVVMSDEEARIAMEFVAGEHPGAALILTGPSASGKTWLANVLDAMGTGLVVIDPIIDDLTAAPLQDLEQTFVIVARDLGDATKYIGRRDWAEIRRKPYTGSFGLTNKTDTLLVEEIEHVMGRKSVDELLTEKVRAWALRESIRPADFARKTGFSYQHAYNLLSGSGRVSDETLGRISRTYGAQVLDEILNGKAEAA